MYKKDVSNILFIIQARAGDYSKLWLLKRLSLMFYFPTELLLAENIFFYSPTTSFFMISIPS